MAITPAEFKAKFPEFASIADATIQLSIDESVIILNENYWGTKYNLGLYYLSAHFLVIAEKTAGGSSGGSGPVSSKAVDGTSLSYAITSMDDAGDIYYNQSSYGQRYLALRETLGVPAAVV